MSEPPPVRGVSVMVGIGKTQIARERVVAPLVVRRDERADRGNCDANNDHQR